MRTALFLSVFLCATTLLADVKPLEPGDRYYDKEAEITFRPPKGWPRAKPKGRSGIVYTGPQRGEIILRFGYSVGPRPLATFRGDLVPLGDMKAQRVALPIRLSESTQYREEYRVIRKTDMLLVWFERPEKAKDVAKLYEDLRASITDWSTLIDRSRFSFRIPGPGWAEGWKFPKGYEDLSKDKPAGAEGVERAFIHHEKHPAIIRMIHVTTAQNAKLSLGDLRDQYVATIGGDGVVVETREAKERLVSGAKALVTPVRLEVEKDGRKVVTRRGVVAVVRRKLDFFVLVAVDYTAKVPEARLLEVVNTVLTSTAATPQKRNGLRNCAVWRSAPAPDEPNQTADGTLSCSLIVSVPNPLFAAALRRCASPVSFFLRLCVRSHQRRPNVFSVVLVSTVFTTSSNLASGTFAV